VAIVSLWNNLHIPDSEANVKFVNYLSDGYLLEHNECGEVFEFVYSTDIQECPHCQGDIIFPREDW